MKEVVLAMDLGGTNTRFGAVRWNGEIIARHRIPTPEAVSAVEFVNALAAGYYATAQIAGVTVEAIAAAIPATVGMNTKTLAKLPNLPILEGVDLKSELSKRLNVEVVLENDATAATIGEHWLGVSQGKDSVIGVTLGTGIGGGIFINGLPYRGKDGSAGEIGHICVEPDGHSCGCGSRGCIEQYSSGTAIVRAAIAVGLDISNPKDVFDLAIRGEEKAIAVFSEVGRYLGIVLAGLINTLNPDMIVIGGGVAAGWDMFIDPLHEEVRQRAYREPAERANIVRAELGDDAGVLGAAKVAFDNVMPF